MTVTALERPAAGERPGEPPGGVVIPLHRVRPDRVRPHGVRPLRVAAAASQSPQTPLRLTRRGRLALTLATVSCALAITGLALSSADASAAQPKPAATASVLVGQGDTIWTIARRADPQADPRVTVARIIALNDLPGGHISRGQRLLLPAS